MKKLSTAQLLIAGALIVLSVTVMTGWLMQNSAMVQFHSGWAAMVFNTGLCFFGIGVALILPENPAGKSRPPRAAIGCGLIALAFAVFVQHIAGVDFLLDWPQIHYWLDDTNPRPGRMALNTCLGFMLCGLVLVLMQRVRNKATGMAIKIASFAVIALGLIGLASYSLHLDQLDLWLRWPHMAIPTALGMILAGAGLWITGSHIEWQQARRYVRDDEKVAFDGERRLLAGTVRDSTERKRTEAALFEEKERLRVTLSLIGDAVITTDTAGNVTYLNPVAEHMTGWSKAEAHRRPLLQVFHIVNETTGELAADPVESALHEQAKGPAQDTLLLQRGGARFAIQDSAAPIRDRDGTVIGVVVVFHDVSEARKMAAQMTHQASHDALTGLINRHEFERRLELSLQSGKAEYKQHTLLYLDLDQFKIVNDTCGHVAGDELLRQLTGMLQARLRQSDTLGRLGGDEFGVLLESCPTDPALRIAELLKQTISDFHFAWHDKTFPIGVSIGLVTFSNDGMTLPDVLRMADAACYVAKDKGRNRIQVYTPEDKELAQRHGEMGWIGRIQRALDEDRFVLYAQRIMPLRENPDESEHFELLLRMVEDGKPVPPMAFIPAAERYGLMPAIDRWVIQRVLAHYAEQDASSRSSGTCAINLSGSSICDEGFVDFALHQFELYDVAPSKICFEITETSAIANLNHAAVLIQKLKAIGCRFSLDDFGSGMSSFAYLKHLPVDYLKIDGGFVKDMIDDPIDYAMVESINHIGHVMGIQTIAEFAENDAILDALRKIGVDFAQGYGIGKPAPSYLTSTSDTSSLDMETAV